MNYIIALIGILAVGAWCAFGNHRRLGIGNDPIHLAGRWVQLELDPRRFLIGWHWREQLNGRAFVLHIGPLALIVWIERWTLRAHEQGKHLTIEPWWGHNDSRDSQ